jgi:hypothetical protein
MNLLQTAIPNGDIADASEKVLTTHVMAGLEYPRAERTAMFDGVEYASSIANVIVRMPATGESLTISRGDRLAWFVVVPKTFAVREVAHDAGT